MMVDAADRRQTDFQTTNLKVCGRENARKDQIGSQAITPSSLPWENSTVDVLRLSFPPLMRLIPNI